MSSSPAELPAEHQLQAGFPHCPPEATEYANFSLQEEQKQRAEHTRREVLKWGALLSMGAVLGYNKVAQPLIQQATDKHWPARPTTIGFVNARAKIADRRRINIVFPGFGQMDSYNSASEYAAANNDQELVAFVSNSTRIMTPENVGAVMWDFFEQHDTQEVNIAGNSMGMIVGMMGSLAVHTIIASSVQHGRIPPNTTFPTMLMTAANCSPSDVHDAFDGDLATNVAYIVDKTGYTPDFVGKLIYDLGDGDGDTYRLLNVFDRQQFLNHLADSFQQATNETSPYTAFSQASKFLLPFNWVEQSRKYIPILNPTMTAVYVQPNNFDGVVNDNKSADKWEYGYKQAGVDQFVRLYSGMGGHANTVDFANAISRFRKARGNVF